MNLQKLKYFLVILIAGMFSGCGVWDNFTTYFNLYYNMSSTFDEAEKLIKAQDRDLFSTEPFVIPGSASPLLTKVIEKSSKILQHHSETSFVDEALMMVGKSFYYQRDYQKALRKFTELLASQPESEYVLEARLWIAKTQMKLKNYSEALALLGEVRTLAIEEGEDDFIKEAFVEEAVYKIQTEQYDEAIVLANDFLAISDDDEINADVVYELGRLYVLTEDLEKAIASFGRVNDYAPSYDVDYKARIEMGKALRSAGRLEESRELFADMASENKYFDFLDEIELERGITLNELGRSEEAVEVLVNVDTSYATSLNSGIARLKIGEIYEYKLLNYDSATAYYQKATTSQAPPEYVVLAASKNRLFTKYNTLAGTYRENQKQLNYLVNPETFTTDSLEYAQKLEELKLEEDLSYLFEVPVEVDTSKTSLDSLTMLKNLDSLGVLKRFDSLYVATELDSLEMTTLLDSIKFAENERILNEQEQKQRRGSGGDGGGGELGEGQDTSAISKLVKPVKTGLSQDSINALLLKNKFDIANLFFTELNVPDSAYNYYSDIISNHPGSQYEGQTLFTIGSYYEIKGDTLKADSLYNVVYDNYKTESVVNAAANKIKKPLIALNYDPAEVLYIEAERTMLSENYDSSIVSFYNIYETFPSSPLAPKALYAGGWILENKLDLPDSAAVFYDSIVVNYPLSDFTSVVMPKLNVYKAERDRIKQAMEDSLAQISSQQQPGDTTVIDTTLNTGIVPSDTTETFNLIDRLTDSLYLPEDTLRIRDEDRNIYGDPGYFEDPDLPREPVDSLLLQQQIITDSLQGHDRRGIDSSQFISPPLDSLNPGRPGGPP